MHANFLLIIADDLAHAEMTSKVEEVTSLQGELFTALQANKQLQAEMELLKTQDTTEPVHSSDESELQRRLGEKSSELQEKEARILLLQKQHEEFQNVFNSEKGRTVFKK